MDFIIIIIIVVIVIIIIIINIIFIIVMIRSNSCFLFEIYSNFLFFSTTWINLISIRLKSPNSYFIIKITYCPHCFSIFSWRIAKITTMTPEQPVIIEPICAVQISSNLQFSKVLKFGTLFLFQSLVRQTCLALRRKCKSFYLNNHWIGLAAHSQHFFFPLFIVVSEVALP